MISIQKISIRIIYSIILLFLFSCSNNKSPKEQNEDLSYDFEVLYRYQGEENYKEDKYRKMLSSDTIYFIIESEFQNNFLVINAEDKNIFNGEVRTEPSSGVAEEIKVGCFRGINNITVQIDKGPKINFDIINKEHNIIGIRKKADRVSIVFYKKVPMFD